MYILIINVYIPEVEKLNDILTKRDIKFTKEYYRFEIEFEEKHKAYDLIDTLYKKHKIHGFYDVVDSNDV